MADVRSTIRSQEGALERLRRRIPGFGTYHDREARREADRVLRAFGVAQLEAAVRDLHEAIKRLPLGEIRPYQELVKVTEWVANELRHSDRGYSGFFAELAWDSETVLDSLYEQDEEIVGAVAELAAHVATAEFDPSTVESELRALQRRFADRRNKILALTRS